MRFEKKYKDGLCRIGILTDGDLALPTPAVIDPLALFPGLGREPPANIPLCAGEEFTAREYHTAGEDQPLLIYPSFTPSTTGWPVVMVPCWQTALARPRDYTRWLVQLRSRVPPGPAWYAPAAALPRTAALLCYSGFDLFDTTGVDLATAQDRFCLPEGEFPGKLVDEGLCSCPGCLAGDLGAHNRNALSHELALCAYHIREGRFREFFEARCRLDPAQVAVLRLLDREYPLMEPEVPVVRPSSLGAASAESLTRAEVRRFAERVAERYIPPEAGTVVLLPCSARKPYSFSRTHRLFIQAIAGRAHEVILTSPLGLVPRELECVYPAAHYDVPVTGYWDREEKALIAGPVTRYLARNHYKRVISHLSGGAREVVEMAAASAGVDLEQTCTDEDPVSPPSLSQLSEALSGERTVRHDLVAGVGSWQFGTCIPTRGLQPRGRYPALIFSRNRVPFFSVEPATGLIRPTFAGWELIPGVYRVSIDRFIPEGDILAPGVTGADPAIREGDEVLVEGESARATGRAAMNGCSMRSSRRGVAVRVRKVKRLACEPVVTGGSGARG